MDDLTAFRAAVDPSVLAAAAGYQFDPWQREVAVHATAPGSRLLVAAGRQVGKSTCQAVLGVWFALYRPQYDVIVAAPAVHQSTALITTMRKICRRADVPLARDAATSLELAESGEKIRAVPAGVGARGYTAGLLITDESAFISDSAVSEALAPTLAAVPGGGAWVATSSPNGERGWWWDAWANGGDSYQRWHVPWNMCPRLSQDFVEHYRRTRPRHVFAQEFEADFVSSSRGIWAPALIDSMFVDDDELPFELPLMREAA
nr:hypothetical protein [Streptomyces sp. DSM 41633]